MTPKISALLADEHVADLHRAAARRRRAAGSPPPAVPTRRVELRLAHAGEADLVARLAALDDARALQDPVLLAFVDDEAVAGLSLRDRRVTADPFVDTGEAVALLRLRADHLSSSRARPRWRRRPRVRFA